MTDLIARTIAVLATSVDRWAALARLDAGDLARAPEPGEWSAVQCLGHVVDTEGTVFRSRVLAILDGRDFPAFDPDAEGSRVTGSMGELAVRLAPLRAESLGVLATLTLEDLPKTGRHAELGLVSLAELLNEWAAHDTMHLVQAERAVMQAFIPGSGPWRPYFAAHDVDAALH